MPPPLLSRLRHLFSLTKVKIEITLTRRVFKHLNWTVSAGSSIVNKHLAIIETEARSECFPLRLKVLHYFP